MITNEVKFENFDDTVKKDFWIVDFFSETCGPCKMLSKVLEEIHIENPIVNIAKVSVTKNPELAKKFEVTAVPVMLFVNEGEVKEKHLGAMPKPKLEEKINKIMYE